MPWRCSTPPTLRPCSRQACSARVSPSSRAVSGAVEASRVGLCLAMCSTVEPWQPSIRISCFGITSHAAWHQLHGPFAQLACAVPFFLRSSYILELSSKLWALCSHPLGLVVEAAVVLVRARYLTFLGQYSLTVCGRSSPAGGTAYLVRWSQRCSLVDGYPWRRAELCCESVCKGRGRLALCVRCVWFFWGGGGAAQGL